MTCIERVLSRKTRLPGSPGSRESACVGALVALGLIGCSDPESTTVPAENSPSAQRAAAASAPGQSDPALGNPAPSTPPPPNLVPFGEDCKRAGAYDVSKCADRYCGKTSRTTGAVRYLGTDGLAAIDELCQTACDTPYDAHICRLRNEAPGWRIESEPLSEQGWTLATYDDVNSAGSVWGCNGSCDDHEATPQTAFTSALLLCSDAEYDEDQNVGSTFGPAGYDEQTCDNTLPVLCCATF